MSEEEPYPRNHTIPFVGIKTDLVCAALVKAQAKFVPVEKTKTVKTPSFSYTYAPLEAINQMIQKPLGENGLAHVAILEGMMLHVRLIHSSGQTLESSIQMEANRDPKIFGGNVTYMKRILLSALLGISTEDSDSDGPQATPTRARANPPRKAAAKRAAQRPSKEAKREPGVLDPRSVKEAVGAHLKLLTGLVGKEEAENELRGIYNHHKIEKTEQITTQAMLDDVVGRLTKVREWVQGGPD